MMKDGPEQNNSTLVMAHLHPPQEECPRALPQRGPGQTRRHPQRRPRNGGSGAKGKLQHALLQCESTTTLPSSATCSSTRYNLDDYMNTSRSLGELLRLPPIRRLSSWRESDATLGEAWSQGLDIIVQMVAQELSRLARSHEGQLGQVLNALASVNAPYRNPHFELGVAITCRWRFCGWERSSVMRVVLVLWPMSMMEDSPRTNQ